MYQALSIALCFVFCLIIVLIIYRDFKEKKLMIDENRKLEKAQFYQQYPQFFVRENWEIIGSGCFKFLPTNDIFEINYITYYNGESVISFFSVPPGFSNVFHVTKKDFIKNYLWAIIKESLKDKHSKLINSVKEKYPPAFQD